MEETGSRGYVLDLSDERWVVGSPVAIRALVFPDGTVAVEDEDGRYVTEAGDAYVLDDDASREAHDDG